MTATTTETFVERAVTDLAACYGGVMISIGHKLGLYRALAGRGPSSSVELAARTSCEERYVREWLNSQVAAGYLAYHEESDTYELPAAHVPVLADEESPLFMPPAFDIPASMWFDQERTLEAFRTGDGVPWGERDSRLACGVAVFYRNAYRAALVPEWLPALDGVVEKLERGALVADVGCGHGHSTILMAQAFEQSRFVGFDTDEASIEAARANAEAAGVADRVEFHRADAGSYTGEYDLICFFDCLHDLGDPVGAARHARGALAEDGTLLVVEPFAGDGVGENLGPVGRLYYSASTAICVPHSRSEGIGLALGAQAGPAQLAAVFREAGFGSIRRAHETPFNIVLEVRS
ncbi:MAG TPA: class I SAM-dependent methyltransferase [Gaiellaceae bacterium]|nr:class I SAM-dependent methyltransferase [Gaiellaceae bacterium]